MDTLQDALLTGQLDRIVNAVAWDVTAAYEVASTGTMTFFVAGATNGYLFVDAETGNADIRMHAHATADDASACYLSLIEQTVSQATMYARATGQSILEPL